MPVMAWLPGVLVFVGLAFVIRWLVRYTEQWDSGNAGDDQFGIPWTRQKDSTHTAYRRRYKELASALDALGQDITEPTTRVAQIVQAPVTEARTEAER